MNTFGISEKSYNLIIEAFIKNAEIETVILFGSRAKGNYKRGSDIDLALKGKNTSPTLALNVSAHLNEELPIPYFVDVLDYNTIDNEDLKAHIDRVGVMFYEKNVAFLVE